MVIDQIIFFELRALRELVWSWAGYGRQSRDRFEVCRLYRCPLGLAQDDAQIEDP
jgi:hypothetical protein